jgi:1,4-alpha-glucan branching enzyme
MMLAILDDQQGRKYLRTIPDLADLGINCTEVMPVNMWLTVDCGYDPIGYSCVVAE